MPAHASSQATASVGILTPEDVAARFGNAGVTADTVRRWMLTGPESKRLQCFKRGRVWVTTEAHFLEFFSANQTNPPRHHPRAGIFEQDIALRVSQIIIAIANTGAIRVDPESPAFKAFVERMTQRHVRTRIEEQPTPNEAA